MHRYMRLAYGPVLLCCCASVVVAAPGFSNRSYAASSAREMEPAVVEAGDDGTGLATDAGQSAASLIAPAAPEPDANGLSKNRFITFSNSEVGLTAIRVTFVSLHHVDPPYTGGPSVPFTLFENESQYVGPPTRYVESLSSGTPFQASTLQCEPHYHDWSTVGLLSVTGEAIVPSSIYDVEVLAGSCRDVEAQCAAVSDALTIETSRWGDIGEAYNTAGSGELPDFADISELVNKFKNAPGAPTKTLSMLIGTTEIGVIDPRPELSFSHVAGVVDAFQGIPYPHKPGRCSNNSIMACISDEECSGDGTQPPGMCVLCGEVVGGACCHGDGTCDILPRGACSGPNDSFKGVGEPCSRCCGPSPGCVPLTNFEWFDAQQLWPNLDRRDICKEAEEDPTFNCVSWAIDDIEVWIWDEVDLDQDGLWEYSDFEAYFAQYQKSAIIYGANNNAVYHAAKPLPNNCASSKAGGWFRIRHDRNQIEGGYYGDILGTYAY